MLNARAAGLKELFKYSVFQGIFSPVVQTQRSLLSQLQE